MPLPQWCRIGCLPNRGSMPNRDGLLTAYFLLLKNKLEAVAVVTVLVIFPGERRPVTP